jgi:nucleotide-binding universal stress UspA family protein
MSAPQWAVSALINVILGSVTSGVLGRSQCPVLLIH